MQCALQMEALAHHISFQRSYFLMKGNAVLDFSAMPPVVFIDPQVATVGLSEVQAS